MGSTVFSKLKIVPRSIAGALISVLIAWLTLLSLLVCAPKLSTLSSYQIEPEAISVLPLEGLAPFRRRLVNEQAYTVATGGDIGEGLRRQYTYRFNFDSPPTQGGEVFIPFIGADAHVYVNGVILGQSENLPAYLAGQAKQFVSLPIPATTFQSGINRLIIVATPDETRAGFPFVYFAQQGELPKDTARFNTRIETLQGAQLLIGLGLMLFSILKISSGATKGRYLCLSGLGLGFCILALAAVPPISGMGGGYVFITVLGYSIILSAVMGALKFWPDAKSAIDYGIWLAAIVTIFLALVLLLPFAHSAFTYRLMPLTALGAFPFAIWFSALSIASDKQLIVLSKAALEAQLAKQQAIITAQKKAIEDSLKAKGRLEERQRLTRDIHDGIGGQLLSLLVRVKGGEMSRTEIENDLQYGLNDLRLIVDSMDHSASSLDEAFVTFRARAAAQLNAAKIKLIWEKSDPFIPSYFGPAAILNIYRLMQEVVTNAIRHSECDTIIINVTRATLDDDLKIVMTDNGIGYDPATPSKAGQGLKNMTFRAKAIDAELHLAQLASGGTRVKLSIPPQRETET